jgi:hypothetical protein
MNEAANACQQLFISVMQSNGYTRSLDDPAVSVRNAPLGTGTVHSHANDCAPTRTAGESGGDHAMLLEE